MHIGSTISHYKIVEKLGEGGMGVVYKAEDTLLQRCVALKFLATHLLHDERAQDLLWREARAAAALNHPNVCVTHGIETSQGRTFIVMEFIEGWELAHEIEQGPMDIERVWDVGRQVAEGLAAAHARGVVHRDVKPSNIMLTPNGRAITMDFGVALLATAGNNSDLGAPVAGTCSYMSPEQACGDPVDANTDVWALGVVLYEMISGERPFQGEYQQSIIYSILNEDPVPLSSLRPGLPGRLNQIVSKALSRIRPDRYADMDAMISDLVNARREEERKSANDEAAAGVWTKGVRSIAVLPFANRSAESENEYFSDGLTDEITSALSQVRGLRVISRGSSFRFKGRSEDARAVGGELGVDFVVDGSVKRSADRLRVIAQLISVEDGVQVWSQGFNHEIADAIEMQDELTSSIIEKLRLQFVDEAPSVSPARRAGTRRAYDAYLQGLYCLNQQTEESLRTALAHFLAAAAADRDYAMPYVGLARCYRSLAWYGYEPATEVMPRAIDAAQDAIRFDESLAEAHTVLAAGKAGYEWNWLEAAARFKKAVTLGSGFASVHFHYALDYLTPLGRLDEALEELRIAQRLDPLSPLVHTALGGCYLRQGCYDEAVEQLKTALSLEPRFFHAHWTLARTLEQQKQFAAAGDAFACALEEGGASPAVLADRGHCLGAAGNEGEARKVQSQLREMSKVRYVSPLSDALVHLGLGENDLALDSVRLAHEHRAQSLVWIAIDSRYDPIRSNAQFQKILTSVGLSQK